MAQVTNPHYGTVRDRFKQYRKHLGLSQAEFGEKLDLDQTAISTIEVGKQDVTIRTIYALIDLDCNPNWLLLGLSPMQLSSVTKTGATVEVKQRKGLTEYIVRVATT